MTRPDSVEWSRCLWTTDTSGSVSQPDRWLRYMWTVRMWCSPLLSCLLEGWLLLSLLQWKPYYMNQNFLKFNILTILSRRDPNVHKHSGSIPRNACVVRERLPRKCDYLTDRRTPDKVIPMCWYASQLTQKCRIYYNQQFHIMNLSRPDKFIILIHVLKSLQLHGIPCNCKLFNTWIYLSSIISSILINLSLLKQILLKTFEKCGR